MTEKTTLFNCPLCGGDKDGFVMYVGSYDHQSYCEKSHVMTNETIYSLPSLSRKYALEHIKEIARGKGHDVKHFYLILGDLRLMARERDLARERDFELRDSKS